MTENIVGVIYKHCCYLCLNLVGLIYKQESHVVLFTNKESHVVLFTNKDSHVMLLWSIMSMKGSRDQGGAVYYANEGVA